MDRKFAAEYGFDDDFLYDELIQPIATRKMPIIQQSYLYDDVKHVFECWKDKRLPLC